MMMDVCAVGSEPAANESFVAAARDRALTEGRRAIHSRKKKITDLSRNAAFNCALLDRMRVGVLARRC
jgi:hypothetical protein